METAGMNPFSPTAGGGTQFQLSGAVPQLRRRPERERCAELGQSDHRQGRAVGRARDANRRGLHQLTVPGARQSSGHAHVVLDAGGVLALPVAHPHLVRWLLPPQRRQQRLCRGRRHLSVPGWHPVAADHRPALQRHRRHRRQLDGRPAAHPGFAAYATSIGRPWYLSAWSACLQDNEQDGWDNYTSDSDAALHVTDMLNLAAGKPITNYQPYGRTTAQAAGFSFWNLGNQAPTTCDIGPTYAPISFAALTSGVR